MCHQNAGHFAHASRHWTASWYSILMSKVLQHTQVAYGPTIEVRTQIEVPRTLIEVLYLNLGMMDDSLYLD
jgi:hypothetical protein